VVGSIIWPEQTSILSQATAPAQQVYDDVTYGLRKAGWVHRPFGARDGGFAHVNEPGWSREFFCHQVQRYHLVSDILSLSDGLTDVWMEISTDPEDSRCREEDDTESKLLAELYPRLPQLMPPSGTAQRSVGSGGTEARAYSSGEVFSDLDLSSIQRHYAGQIAAAGWHAGGSGESEHSAWTTWWREDESGVHYQGLLSVVRLPRSNSYIVQVHTARTTPFEPSERRVWRVWGSS
jgi:hypothetical protein